MHKELHTAKALLGQPFPEPERSRDIAAALPDHTPELAALIPRLILDGMQRYAVHHEPTGGFLLSVLANDLTEAVCRADDASLAAILPIVKYVYNCLPSRCHGSPEKVKAWLKLRVVAEEDGDE